MSSIQAFWFVAFALADRMATLPAPPICSAMRSTWLLAMPSALAWLTYRSRQSSEVSESKVTTFVPASRASLMASQIALGSFGGDDEGVHALLRAVLMYCTCASGLASCGPTSSKVPPNSSTASSPPASLVSK
jgi:hypothetical protein